MLLWTIMPEDIILDGLEKPRRYREIKHEEKNLIVELGEDGYGTIVKLLSTDPQDFLQPVFQPGKEILLN